MRNVLLAALAALSLAAVAPATADTSPPCRGGDLAATFAFQPGGASAGHVVYLLRVVNRSPASCFVTGLPGLALVGFRWKPLPTRVVPAFPGALTAVRVELAPGAAAAATARFSPDVPGVGEPRAGRLCEPTAYRVLVTPSGGGTTSAPLRPRTPVCEHGRLELRAFSASR